MRGIRLLQGLVLLCILMVPILIILFLKTFGNNQYEIPVLFENGIDNQFMECDVEENVQHTIPEFSFTSQDGLPMGRAEMEGKITIVDFFFTSCPSICPVMSTEMERVDDVFRGEDRVQIYSISIDPEYDSPEVLKEYAERHNASPGKWFFLTGDQQETFNLARCGFLLPALDGKGVPDDFVHSDKFVIVDEQGRIRGFYSGTTREDVDLLILETKILLYGKK
ncbi:photosynthetic protein synthase I [Rhodonellum psychrophilum GCM71 = DSM 17998]|uniref:Photosynthetic protein synthase I n=2 Tax=Rhodonellum TaxID=336827 RepID=U5C4J7_9BACT|nr:MULTISPECIES: SCO family protein [Rhodonellum]ERM83132.1 photosynthetic protein synthase I [Rhodonellum psychrophilum GCM71 = DSM 17998]SDY98466.1 protein SCO1/2 [Rhodonellum ikkaensis]